MAVNINDIKYLPDLPAAKALTGTDLLHVNQSGTDAKLTLSALMPFIWASMFPVGTLLTSQRKGYNPNTLYPGTVWIRWGQGNSLRVCSDDESNIGTTAGSDTVTLSGGNMPAHTHEVHANTSAAGAHSHNAWTDTQGQHSHRAWTDTQGNHQHQGGIYSPGAQYGSVVTGSDNSRDRPLSWTSVNGAHSHNVGMDGAGAHGHNIGMNGAGNHNHEIHAATTSSGSGAAFSVVNRVAYVSAWVRQS